MGRLKRKDRPPGPKQGSRLGLPCAAACLLAVSSAARGAAAEDSDASYALPGLEVHGFVSQGYIKTTSNNFLAKSKNSRGSFEFSEVGLNFTQPLGENLRAGVQLFAHDVGPVGNYDIKADWFYLDYRYADWLGLRAGRIKLPFGLYNEFSDIDSARVPILLPQSTYPTRNRDYLLAQTGFEVYGHLFTGAAGALDYRLYGGTIFLESSSPTLQVLELNAPYLFGGRLLWESPLEGLRLGGSVQRLRLDTRVLQGDRVIEAKIPALLWMGSLEYASGDLTLAAEYGRWHVSITSNAPDLYPTTKRINERGYLMAALRLNEWFEPGAYYSVLFPNVKDRHGKSAQQHDAALTLRFDLGPHWLFKLEGHYMLGTADLAVDLNAGVPLQQLERHWGAFLAKTTAYF